MNCRKNTFVLKLLFAVLALTLLTSGFYSFNRFSKKDDLTFDEALNRIKSSEVKEVHIQNGKVQFTTNSGGNLLMNDISEPQREVLTDSVFDYNSKNSRNSITFILDPKASNPMDKIFQLIFILFFISPPIIAVLLFLIWRELKERNKMK